MTENLTGIEIVEKYFADANIPFGWYVEDRMDWRQKELWLRELRTTEIPQTKYVLGDEADGMCCLGIYSNICVEQNVIDGFNSTAALPDGEVVAHAHWKDKAPVVGWYVVNGKAKKLVATVLNDGATAYDLLGDRSGSGPEFPSLTFAQIADVVEEVL